MLKVGVPFDTNANLLFDKLEALLVPALVQNLDVDVRAESHFESLRCGRHFVVSVQVGAVAFEAHGGSRRQHGFGCGWWSHGAGRSGGSERYHI
jgi:hypothetical protein